MTSSVADFLCERAELRRLNLNPSPQRSAFAARSSGLKFDVKKATALAKRFKNYSAEASEKTILTQLDTVSFGMFLSEAAHAVVQSLCHGTKMKQADAHSFAVVCSEVHQRYEVFWSLVRKELKDNIETIVDTGALKMAVERIEEYASTTASGAGDGNAPTATAATPPGSSVPPAATVKGSPAPSLSKSPVDEFNRLRLVVRVFCEWWLVGLFEDAKPVLNLLKLLHNLAERRAAAPNSPLAAATVFSITAFVIREVGIEMLGKENAALSCLPAESTAGDKGPEGLRDFVGHCGVLTVDENGEEGSKKAFLLGPAGARLAFNTTTKAVGPVEDAVAHQAEEASWARLCEARNLPSSHYSKDEEKKQFFGLALASTKACLRAYKQRKEEAEKWWHSLNDQAELRAKHARLNTEEARFRLFQEHVERLYVVCDNLLGMLGYVAPLPIDLSIVEQKEDVEAVRISVTRKFHPIVGAETLNRFGDDEHRVFYEYVPEIEAFADDVLLSSLTAEKANWELFSRHSAIGGAIASGTGRTTLSASSAVGAVGVGGASGGGDGGDSEKDDVDMDATAHTVEEGKSQRSTEAAALMERRRLRLAKLAVPAVLFDDYAAVLSLLEEVGQCTTAAAMDEWCERFVGEALQPLRRSSENVVGGKLFFTNCRMLLTLELRHFLLLRHGEKVPLMARCAAIFHQYFPDVGEYLGGKLEAQWRREYSTPASTKETGNACGAPSDGLLQRRVRATGRYLCELMKFGTIPPSRVLGLFAIAVEDLMQPCSAAAISAIIEHGGLFLVRNHATRRTAEKLIQKLKTTMRKYEMGNESSHMITEAFAFLEPVSSLSVPCSPPPKQQNPLECYVRHLLHESLCRERYEFVLNRLLKMPWDNVECRDMLIRALRGAHQMSWDAVPLLVDILGDLVHAGYFKVVQRIVHEVAEDMRRDLEVGAAITERVQGGARNPMTLSEPHSARRPLQWRLVDCFFVANFYRVRLVSFRFVGHILLMLLLYVPSSTPHRNDSSRLQCFVTLLSECIPFLPWAFHSRIDGFTGARSRALRSMERLASLHQLLRKLMALLYLHRFSLTEPLPLQLQLRVKGLVQHLSNNMCRDESHREACMKLHGKKRPQEEESQKDAEDGLQKDNSQLEGPSSQKLIFPETLEEAHAYAKAVAEEAVLPANAWYEKVYEAIRGSKDDKPFFHIFAVGNQNEPPTCTSEAVRTEGSGAENATHALLDLLPEDMGQADEVSTEDSGDADESDNSRHRAGVRGSCSTIGSISGSSSSGYDSGAGSASDSDNIGTSVALSATVSEITSTAEEEEEEEDEEETEEEEEEEDEEETEEEEEEEEEDSRFAAAESLRLRLEEADLDAELRALMSENPREAMGQASSAAIARGVSVERLMEQDLAMGIRMHRQHQRQCAQHGSSVPQLSSPKEDTVQEVHFTLLRRPPPNSSAAGKTGNAGVAAAAVHSPTTTVASASAVKKNNVAVLRIPRGVEFAQNALMSQERHRQQQEELREITRRINRMHEVERSVHAVMPREAK